MSTFKRITLPGFERVPLHRVIKFMWKELRSPILMLRAQAIAYSFFLAIFPTIIFLFSLLAHIPLKRYTNDIIGYLKNVLPNKQMVEVFVPIVNDVLAQPPSSMLSIGFFLIIFFMKDGIVTMMQSFNVHFNVSSGKFWIKNQIIAILITLTFLLLFIVTIILIVLGKDLMNLIFRLIEFKGKELTVIIDVLRYIVTLGLSFIVISILYYFGPAVRPRKFKVFTPGSIVASSMIIGVSFLFAFYIKNFGNYNKLYGSMGTIILTLIWLYWNSLSILIGFELNRSIAHLRTRI
jgi:membrane protein